MVDHFDTKIADFKLQTEIDLTELDEVLAEAKEINMRHQFPHAEAVPRPLKDRQHLSRKSTCVFASPALPRCRTSWNKNLNKQLIWVIWLKSSS